MHCNSSAFTLPISQRGFSMLEILITLVIIATALLGTAGLQIYAMRMGQSGQFRTQAVFLAADLAERMEANKAAAVAGAYVNNSAAAVATGVDCLTSACDSANLALYDLNQWRTAVASVLPQPTWTVTRTIAGDPSTYSITINWIDRSSEKNTHGETFTYIATRTVSSQS